MPYETFKREFLRQFHDPNQIQKLELELQALKWDRSELPEYVFKVKTIAYKIDPNMSEATLINHLLRGLPTSVKSVLTLFPYSNIAEF